MAPITAEEQFRFLLSCIRYSNNGKVDFEKVAGECEIISKGAAAKRYERLMKSNNISVTGASQGTSGSNRSPEKSADDASISTSATATPTKKAPAAPGGAKRKKADSSAGSSPKKAKAMKKAAVLRAEDLVKKEFEGSDDEKGGEDEDDTDGSLFKGISGEPEVADTYA